MHLRVIFIWISRSLIDLFLPQLDKLYIIYLKTLASDIYIRVLFEGLKRTLAPI